jgi:hypothetical protein
MATRAEQFRAETQRRSSVPKKKAKLSPGPPRTKKGTARSVQHAAKKASYALESSAPDGRRSRKSTRGSANRMKPDSPLNIRESLVKGSPEAKARKARAQSVRVRGSRS